MMEQMAIFSATLGLSPPWSVTAATFAQESNRLDLRIEYVQSTPWECPECGRKAAAHMAEMTAEVWYHEDFFRHATYLHALVPATTCGCGCAVVLDRPWSRAGSKFARLR